MIKRFKLLLSALPILITAFSPVHNGSLDTETYYSLMFFKNSSPPREMRIINTGNISGHKKASSRGVLLSYKNRGAFDVKIAGDFSEWDPLRMNRGKYGVWYWFLIGDFGGRELRYKFIVDGIWILDENNPDRDDDGEGSYVSIIRLRPEDEAGKTSLKFIEKNYIEFRIYKPQARIVSIVGDFNNWNPENDLLVKEKSGIWRLKKRLYRGTYRYKYIIDGEWIVDLSNENTASDDLGGICSVIKVE